jgi:hypothetical protein
VLCNAVRASFEQRHAEGSFEIPSSFEAAGWIMPVASAARSTDPH